MRYLLLIFDDEKGREELSEEEQAAVLEEYWADDDAVREKGNFVASEPLQPTSTTTTVRVRDGKQLVTDGPFAETMEQLGGFHMMEARDLDEAIELAARIPSARTGTIEVRPILELSR